MERKNAVERNGAADAASLGLCGGRGLTRCGAMEEALTWAWRSGASPKARLLEWRNSTRGRGFGLPLPYSLCRFYFAKNCRFRIAK